MPAASCFNSSTNQSNETFAIETTLSSRNYLNHIQGWKNKGYQVVLLFIELDSPELAIRRVAQRVKEGGHDIPKTTIIRRFKRGQQLLPAYCSVLEKWASYNNTDGTFLPQTNQLSDRALKAVIEDAAREAAEEVRDRNKRMGWPVITGEYLRKEKEKKTLKSGASSTESLIG